MSVDLKGQRFGRLTVVERADDYVYPSSHKHAARWKCLCDCGKYKIIRESSLKSGNTTSCGCYRNDQVTVANKIHNKKFNRYIEKDYYIIGYDINNKEFYCDKDDFEKIRNMSWHFDDKWYAVIGKDREKYFLGSYDTEYEAKLARKNAENILFKEFSYSNSRGEQIDD